MTGQEARGTMVMVGVGFISVGVGYLYGKPYALIAAGASIIAVCFVSHILHMVFDARPKEDI